MKRLTPCMSTSKPHSDTQPPAQQREKGHAGPMRLEKKKTERVRCGRSEERRVEKEWRTVSDDEHI